MDETPGQIKKKENLLAVNILRLQNYTDFFDLTEIVLFEWFMVKAFSFKGKQFYYSLRRVSDETRIKEDRLRTIIRRFTKLEIIRVEMKGLPRQAHYVVLKGNVMPLLGEIYQYPESSKLHAYFNKLLPENNKLYTESNKHKGTLKGTLKETLEETAQTGKEGDSPASNKFSAAASSLVLDYDCLEKKYGSLTRLEIKGKPLTDTERAELLHLIDLQNPEREKEIDSAQREKGKGKFWRLAESFESWIQALASEDPEYDVLHLVDYEEMPEQFRKETEARFARDQTKLKAWQTRKINDFLSVNLVAADKQRRSEQLVQSLMQRMNQVHQQRVEMHNKKTDVKSHKLYVPLAFTSKSKRLLAEMGQELTGSQIEFAFTAYIDKILKGDLTPHKVVPYFLSKNVEGDFDAAKTYLDYFQVKYSYGNPNYKK